MKESESGESKKKHYPPIGNLSIKEGDQYRQVAAAWLKKSASGAYFSLRVKAPFTAKEEDRLVLFINKTSFRLALIDRSSILM